jgi:16S rRNA (adenine1518-N6/adenine1519-N6)-dimethyltransferase
MKKSLGQHFLKNKGKIKEIVDSLGLEKGDVVIEIGPGHGELTRELVSTPGVTVIAVEKDRRLVSELKENFKFQISNFETPKQSLRDATGQANSNDQISKLQIVEGDALKILPTLIQNSKFLPRRQAGKIKNSGYKVAGNIPYYITGKLLRITGDLITNYQLPITTIVLTVQKEVAERICAKPPKMNLLAASVQFWAKPEIIGFIPKKDFSPPPEVDSAIVKFEIRNSKLEIQDSYYKLVRILFKQPRKTILNNLAGGPELNKKKLVKKLKELKINPEDRPQNLSVDDIKKLARLMYYNVGKLR